MILITLQTTDNFRSMIGCRHMKKYFASILMALFLVTAFGSFSRPESIVYAMSVDDKKKDDKKKDPPGPPPVKDKGPKDGGDKRNKDKKPV
jgi:hypothetical protein